MFTHSTVINSPSKLTIGDGSKVSPTSGHAYVLAIVNSAGSNTSTIQFSDDSNLSALP
jgi:hypothetical protein